VSGEPLDLFQIHVIAAQKHLTENPLHIPAQGEQSFRFNVNPGCSK
jgi:hypothetical protein